MDNQRIRLTKKLLKEALISCLETKRIEEISVKQIAEKAGINRSTFYIHYKNQQDLLREVEQDFIDLMLNHLSKISTSYTTIEVIQSILEYIRENKKTTKVLLCKNENINFQKKSLGILLEMFKQRITLKLQPAVANYAYHYMLMGSYNAITTWIDNDFDIGAKELAELIFDLSESARDNF